MPPTIPLGEFEARCTKCGAEMEIERSDVGPFAEDKFRCTACGTMFSKPEVERAAVKQNRSQIDREVAKAVEKLIRKTFRK